MALVFKVAMSFFVSKKLRKNIQFPYYQLNETSIMNFDTQRNDYWRTSRQAAFVTAKKQKFKQMKINLKKVKK